MKSILDNKWLCLRLIELLGWSRVGSDKVVKIVDPTAPLECRNEDEVIRLLSDTICGIESIFDEAAIATGKEVCNCCDDNKKAVESDSGDVSNRIAKLEERVDELFYSLTMSALDELSARIDEIYRNCIYSGCKDANANTVVDVKVRLESLEIASKAWKDVAMRIRGIEESMSGVREHVNRIFKVLSRPILHDCEQDSGKSESDA